MPSLVFGLPQPLSDVAAARLSRAAYAVAYDLGLLPVPVPSQAILEHDRLVMQSELSESGHILVPWAIDGYGCRIVETACLRPRPQPYRLLLELARGKLYQLRSYLEDWTSIGLSLPADFWQRLQAAMSKFCKALVADLPGEQDQLAAAVLDEAFRLSHELVREFTLQMLETRLQEEGPLNTLLAARVRPGNGPLGPLYQQAFNAVQLSATWQQTEPQEGQWQWEHWDEAVAAAEATGLPIIGGPLIELSPHALPGWLHHHRGDLPSLHAMMGDYLESVLHRYGGRIRRWIVAAGLNDDASLELDDDHRLRLAYRLVQVARNVDPGLDLVMQLGQPWGDYLVQADRTISPLVFADDLLRDGCQLAAIRLEIRYGPDGQAGMPRDLLDTARMLLLYQYLGVPLEVTVAVAAAASTPAPDTPANVCPHLPAAWTDTTQAEWGNHLVSLALCLPFVKSVTWDGWRDAPSGPATGLLDSYQHPRPLWDRLRHIRQRYLRP